MSSKKRFKSNQSNSTRIKLTPDRSSSEQFINWFPGHMKKAIEQVQSKLKLVDLVLEVRDARAPLLTKNDVLHQALGNKLKLTIFNKNDLADPQTSKIWKTYLGDDNSYLFINILDQESIPQILKHSQTLIEKSYQRENPQGQDKVKKTLMIIGLPNTGKSTLINRLSGRNATKTADKPGHTQHQQWIKIDDSFELLDTPGIMPPKITSYENGLKLSAIYAIPSKIVSEEDTACFLARFLLKSYPESLERRYGPVTEDLDFQSCLEKIGLRRRALMKGGGVDYEKVYRMLIQDFRAGKLGQISLESPPRT